MTDSEINLKLIGFENEYNDKKGKIIELVHELEKLDKLFIAAQDELNKRNTIEGDGRSSDV